MVLTWHWRSESKLSISMEQSPCQTQELPSKLGHSAHCAETELLFRWDETNLVYTLSHFLVRSGFVLSSRLRLRLPRGHLPLNSPTEALSAFLRPPLSNLCDHPTNIWRGAQTLKLRIMKFCPVSVYPPPLSLLVPNIVVSTNSQRPSVFVFPTAWETTFHTHKKQ